MIQTCKICKGTARKFTDKVFDNDYYLCKKCGFISKDEKNLLEPKEEFQIYENHENSIEDIKYVEYFKSFLDKALFKYVTKGEKGIDFGSGPEPVLATILERDYNCQMDVYDLFYAPEEVYKNKIYDFITSTEVIEHLKDPLKYFRFFNKHLKVGGYLGLMTLLHEGDIDEFLEWHYRRDMTHISFFTKHSLLRIAESTGFKLKYCDNHRYIVMKKLNDII